MSIRPEDLRIVFYPDPILRRKASDIPQVTDEVRAVAARMLELMREEDGIGLAAPQVGLDWRMFVARGDDETGDPPDRVFINPVLEVIEPDLIDHEEGCLSLPDIRGQVRRPAGVRVRAIDQRGQSFTVESCDFDARVWQHEFDHLNGVLIIDKFSPLDRMAHRRALKALEAAAGA